MHRVSFLIRICLRSNLCDYCTCCTQGILIIMRPLSSADSKFSTVIFTSIQRTRHVRHKFMAILRPQNVLAFLWQANLPRFLFSKRIIKNNNFHWDTHQQSHKKNMKEKFSTKRYDKFAWRNGSRQEKFATKKIT